MNTRRRMKIKYIKKYYKKYYEKNYLSSMELLLRTYNESLDSNSNNFEYKVITSSPVQGRLSINNPYPKIN